MSEPSDAIAAAVAVFADTWSGRSGGEREAFARGLTSADMATSAPAPPSAETVRVRAALSGAVAPQDLVRGIDEDEAARLLDRLAPEFDQVYQDATWAWTLRSGPRREVLSRLAATDTLADALADAATVPTDEPGRLLRRLARERRIPTDVPLVSAVQALAWAAPLGGLAGELAEARRLAAVRAIVDGYGVLLRHGFFGRGATLDRLEAFAEAPVDPSRPIPLLTLTGVGGTGKSTTLAALLMPYLVRQAGADPTAPAIIVIDFDRLRFRIDAELELSFEVTRQLGAAHPVASADFAALRYQVRGERHEAGADVWRGPTSGESAYRDVGDFEDDARIVVDLHGLGARPVLLVLDTFEEWQRERPYPNAPRESWNDPESRILGWIAVLRSTMGLTGLRVVVSGRAEVAAGGPIDVHAPERLSDLPPSDAQSLLRAQGLTTGQARALAAIVGGNPLTLRVAARYLGRLGADERDAFLAGGAGLTSGLDAELRRAVLYDRFLTHIAEPRVQALAHPGLVLRRVTPALLRQVLAPRCGLGEIDDHTAAELFERLADEVWLVTRDGQALRHRPDVRRGMLRMMVDDPQHVTTARAIHEAAVLWYEHDRSDLPRDAAAVEALYHRLMALPADAEVQLADPSLAVALGESVDDLPRRVAAQVRALRGDDIPEADAHLLPDRVWRDWLDRYGQALTENDEAPRALDLLAARPGQVRTDEPLWRARAFCDAARWHDYWPVDDRLSSERRREIRSQRYAVVNAVCSGDPRQLHECGRRLDEYLSHGPSDGSRLYYALLVDVALEGPSVLPGWRHRRRARDLLRKPAGVRHELPVDQLRDVVTWAATGFTRPVMELPELAGLARPDPRWVADFGQLAGGFTDLPPLDPHARRANDVLSRWSSQAARAFQKGARINRDVLRDRPELLWLLRGDNPELRHGIRRCLSNVLRGNGMRRLGAIATDLVPLPVTELRPEELPPDDAAHRAIVTLVEYVDRSGVMGGFLDAAAAEWPDSEPVRRAHKAYRAWDQANNGLLDALANHLRH